MSLRRAWRQRRGLLGLARPAGAARTGNAALVLVASWLVVLGATSCGLPLAWPAAAGLHAGGWQLLGLAAAAAGGGATLGRRRGRVPNAALAWATLALAGGCLIGLWAQHRGAAALAHVSPRTLAFAPAVAWASATFAASLAVLADARPYFAPTRLAWRIGRRLLLSGEAQVVSTVSRIAVLGVSLGVWLVIVALGILGGFEHDLVGKIVGAGADLTLSRVGGAPLPWTPALRQAVAPAHLPGARAVTPYVELELAVASGSNYAGAVVLGLPDDAGADAVPLLGKLDARARAALAGPCTPHCPVVLGGELAHALGVGEGDAVRLISPISEVLTPLGPVPRSLGGRVVGVLHSKMYEVDSRQVLAPLAVAQKLLALAANEVSGLQLAAATPDAVDALAPVAQRRLAEVLGVAPAQVLPQTWKGRNQTLFAALELERVVAAVTLTFIILVASFSIVNTLSMSIRERRHEIAMLQAMGAGTPLVLQVFLGQGMLIGAIGVAVGAGVGVATLQLLRQYGFGIPYEVYYIDALPVDIAWSDVVGVVAAALLILWNFAVVPSSHAASLRPAEGLRDG